MRRAASIKQYCAKDIKQSRNAHDRDLKTLDSRLWEGNRSRSRDTLQEKLDTLTRKANSGFEVRNHDTYVDDLTNGRKHAAENSLMD